MTRRAVRFAPLALALLVSACGSTSSSSTSPTTTNGITTETFSGTVAVKGSDSKNFTVTVTGVVSATLTVAPGPMNLAIGLPGSSGCVPLPGASVTSATPGTLAQLAGEVTPGTFCVLVADPGTLTAAATYTVTVAHP
jgi:hypothetical protein